eukprot:CAMPEP_0184551096 /NCGR_PEP_ID=MMETSP0199_2-20130426/23483_1 /TAXON_ID=1112570 /ORGANISM="Thraustochytrium sp., Strain LLF1b" /LENGTH=422 /DNA_ID=CAMNT_0026946155 /DNA_START=65 /DNA_END=1333 /DNA_ORIENTATION=-
MPPCTYGAACTRKGCAYVHPKKHVVNEDVVCIPYLTGQCLFGNKCRNKHVSEQEREEMISKMSGRPCRFGSHCKTEGCLFDHPQPVQPYQEAEAVTVDPQLAARLAAQERQKAIYDKLLLEHQQRRLEKMALESQTQQPAAAPVAPPAAKAPVPMVALSPDRPSRTTASARFPQTPALSSFSTQATTPGQNFPQQQIQQATSTATHTKAPNPRAAPFVPQGTAPQQFHFPSLANPGPTPGEAATLQYHEEQEALVPEWGAEAAPSVPLTLAERLKQTADTPFQDLPSETEHQSSVTREIVRIPQVLWVDAASRDPNTFNIVDPLERFGEVNKRNKVAGVLDLHFQTSKTVEHVLSTYLGNYSIFETTSQGDFVWVVTGSGHHTTQRLYKLFDVVQEYLDREGYFYKLGKDSQGFTSAFYVRV